MHSAEQMLSKTVTTAQPSKMQLVINGKENLWNNRKMYKIVRNFTVKELQSYLLDDKRFNNMSVEI